MSLSCVSIPLAFVGAPLLLGGASRICTPSTQPIGSGVVIHATRRRSLSDISWVRPSVFRDALGALIGPSGITISQSRHRGQTAPVPMIVFDDGDQRTIDDVAPLLAATSHRATFFPVAGALGRSTCAYDIHGNHDHVDAATLRELCSAGHEIGSHSMTHADLCRCPDAVLERELTGSRALLEDVTGVAVRSVSFPYGQWNQRVWQAAKCAGYEQACVYSRGTSALPAGMVRVFGSYSFDSAGDIAAKACGRARGVTLLLAMAMAHFAKGTGLWQFRREYTIPSP